jgi:sporulation protein YlmC with PRC-barrel domain
MKKSIFTALVAAASLVLAPLAFTAESEQNLSTHKLFSLDDLEGIEIHTQQGEELGTVDQLVIDIDEGRVAYVIVSSGGLLGIGARTVVVPWTAFVLPSQLPQDDDLVLVLNVEREQFRNAPQGDLETVLDREQGVVIHRYYGVAPYWEGEHDSQLQRGVPPGHQPKEMRGRQDPPGHEQRDDRGRQDPPGHQPIEERGR